MKYPNLIHNNIKVIKAALIFLQKKNYEMSKDSIRTANMDFFDTLKGLESKKKTSSNLYTELKEIYDLLEITLENLSNKDYNRTEYDLKLCLDKLEKIEMKVLMGGINDSQITGQ